MKQNAPVFLTWLLSIKLNPTGYAIHSTHLRNPQHSKKNPPHVAGDFFTALKTIINLCRNKTR